YFRRRNLAQATPPIPAANRAKVVGSGTSDGGGQPSKARGHGVTAQATPDVATRTRADSKATCLGFISSLSVCPVSKAKIMPFKNPLVVKILCHRGNSRPVNHGNAACKFSGTRWS